MLANPRKTLGILLVLSLATTALSLTPSAAALCTGGSSIDVLDRPVIQYGVLTCRGSELCYVEDVTCSGVIQAIRDLP